MKLIKEENFDEFWGELSVIAHRLSDLSDEILRSLPEDGGVVENEGDEIVTGYILFYTIDNLYKNAIALAEDSQLIASAIISRSVVEGMGNVAWLMEQQENRYETARRAKIFGSKSTELDNMINSGIGRVSDFPVNISERIGIFGTGWNHFYKHLCSFTHVDTAYSTHYFRGELKGAINLFIMLDFIALANVIWKLETVLGISRKQKKKLIALKKKLIKVQGKQNKQLTNFNPFIF
jgi:hypothetical protein